VSVFLWVLQGVLAAIFAMAGILKTTQPKDKLQKSLPWTEDVSPMMIRFIGAVELLAAIGLIAPALTGIAPILTPLAAIGLAVVMVLAAITHARRGEPSAIAINIVILVAAAVTAWGRFGPYSL
jgi:uncharacterized membrane protein YphA (DoxX/SURF4 family)